MNDIENLQFTHQLVAAANEAVGLGYRPTRFKQMLNTDGGFETVKRILATGRPSEGFTRLLELGRVDLTCEAIIVESRWRPFFDEDLLTRSEALLKAVHYDYKPYSKDLPTLTTHSFARDTSALESLGIATRAPSLGTTAFFAQTLRTPLTNQRWSWGAANDISRRVFLRLWLEDAVSHENGHRILIQEPHRSDRPGWQERQRHIALLDKGYIGFGVVCTKKQDGEGIADFDDAMLLRLGKRIERDGTVYADIVGSLPVVALVFPVTSPGELTEDIVRALEAGERKTVCRALVDARLGQGLYRRLLLRRWAGACAVTGCTISAVLRASHCKPWRLSSNAERLDSNNGLLLCANLDALFDSGLIAFDDNGAMLIAEQLSELERRQMNLPAQLRCTPNAQLRRYLSEHRRLVFSRHESTNDPDRKHVGPRHMSEASSAKAKS